MTLAETKSYLDSLSVIDALWWFVENVNESSEYRNDLFFYLRERVRHS